LKVVLELLKGSGKGLDADPSFLGVMAILAVLAVLAAAAI
jgi:hypothetical protein